MMKMMKQNKWKLLISSLIILLPILAGLILWGKLPEQMAIHWGPSGTADGFAGRTFAILFLPLFLLVVHWICILITHHDPKNADQSKKALGLTFWICPFFSLFASACVYSTALGVKFELFMLLPVVLGLMFVVIGNLMPKCRQNYTLGVKIKWTLENEENWNATHRFTGKVWVACGLILMLCAFLPTVAVIYGFLGILAVAVAAPIIYSYAYHRKQVREGTADVTTPMPKSYKWAIAISLCVLAVILILCGVLMFTGDIEIRYDADSFTVKADYYRDLTVDYADVEMMYYREDGVPGVRTNGFGSARLLMGTFQNEEFGYYTRYTYADCDACVVLIVNGEKLVLGSTDAESTKKIYETMIQMQTASMDRERGE